MPVRYILSSVWVRLSIFSQLSIIEYMGLCVFSLSISLVMIERIYTLFYFIIIKSDAWTIILCLGLGHETMVCAVCLSIFLSYTFPFMKINIVWFQYHGNLFLGILVTIIVNTLRPRQNGRHFADDTFKPIFVNENIRISIKISLKFVPNIPALVKIMAWRRPGDKPLSEPLMVCLLTHICVTRPRWVNGLAPIRSKTCLSYGENMTSQWPRRRLKSPAARLFTQSFIRAQIKENIKVPRHWPSCEEFTGTGEFPAQRASNAENVSIWWRHHDSIVTIISKHQQIHHNFFINKKNSLIFQKDTYIHMYIV